MSIYKGNNKIAGTPLPLQSGQNGKYLKTNGSTASWESVDALPSQSGQSGKYLTTDGSSASWATIQQAPSTDNETISLNTDQELQAIAVKDNNSNAIKTWTGTRAEYNAIATKDPNTLYNVKGDNEAIAFQAYTKTETNTLLNAKANSSDVYTKTEDNALLDTKLNKQQITNCILEDPQNIKLELNNGTLTLKAGSVVCVPNGFESDGTTPKFDEVTIESDISMGPIGSATSQSGVSYNGTTANSLVQSGSLSAEYFRSGSTDPSPSHDGFWYDTVNNIIINYSSGNIVTNKASFPFTILHRTSGSWDSIDQTFQSIGYIGSTVFVRKGLKVLIPDGRNADGSLKNVEYTTDKTHVFTDNSSTSDQCLYLKNWGNYLETYQRTYDKPTFGYAYYSEKENKSYLSLVTLPVCCIGSLKRTSGVISNFQPYTATNILKYSDKSQISSWGMPSSRYVTLTLGASGSTYVAPANGWFCIRATATSNNAFFNLLNHSSSILMIADLTNNISTQTDDCGLHIPAKKGDEIGAWYAGFGMTQSHNYFRFIYAEGEQ